MAFGVILEQINSQRSGCSGVRIIFDDLETLTLRYTIRCSILKASLSRIKTKYLQNYILMIYRIFVEKSIAKQRALHAQASVALPSNMQSEASGKSPRAPSRPYVEYFEPGLSTHTLASYEIHLYVVLATNLGISEPRAKRSYPGACV